MPSVSKVIEFRQKLRKMPPPVTAGENKTQGLILTVL